MKTVKITFDETGKIVTDMSGFVGGECTKLNAEVFGENGVETDSVKLKPEANAKATERNKQTN